MKIFALTGISASGKTRLLEKLIGELKKRGHTVSAVKHCGHGFDFEPPGKDTERLMEAGADSVWMYSPEGMAVMQLKKADLAIRRVLQEHLKGSDFILIEGGREERSFKKIEVLRKGVSEKLSSAQEELIGIVSDFAVRTDIPVFHPDDIEKIADFMENYPPEKEPQLRLDIDDASIPMNPFVQKIFTNTLMGMIRSLEGIPEDAGYITLSMSRKGKKDEKI